LRQKTTHVVTDDSEFKRRFIIRTPDKLFLDLNGAVVTVMEGDLNIGEPGKTVVYKDGGMIIVNSGELKIYSSIVRDKADAIGIPLTLATAKNNRNIRLISGSRIDAYLVSSGTLRRINSSKNGLRIFGGVAVKYLDFSKDQNDESIFYGTPSDNDSRNRIVWNPDFDITSSEARRRAYRFLLGPTKSYWTSEPY